MRNANSAREFTDEKGRGYSLYRLISVCVVGNLKKPTDLNHYQP